MTESWRNRAPAGQQQHARYTGEKSNQYRRIQKPQNAITKEETWRRPNRNQVPAPNNVLSVNIIDHEESDTTNLVSHPGLLENQPRPVLPMVG